LVLGLFAVMMGACRDATTQPAFGPRLDIVATLPHDGDAYTQGFLFHDGRFYESTGIYGSSSVREVEPATGEVLTQRTLDDIYFGEGLVALKDRLYQATWHEERGFIYALDSLAAVGSFAYSGEGWGLTTDGTDLVLSDGTYRLKFIDPVTFRVERVLEVSDDGRPIYALNELEWVGGEMWANIWQQDNIARIDPTTGEVLGWVNVSGFTTAWDRFRGAEVANGIAYDSVTNRLWVTGKNWPNVFEVEIPRL
jgi:glutaminyl-peptide cyclotransferase